MTKNNKTGTPVSRRSVAQASQTSKVDEGTGQIPTRQKRRSSANKTSAQPKNNLQATQPISTRSKVAASSQPAQTASNTNSKVANKTAETETKEMPTTSRNNKESVKERMKKSEKKARKKEKKRKASAGKNFMITLMVVFFIAAAIIGGWGISQFFWFYIQEKSPVMAAGTPNSRVENTPDIEIATLAAIEEGILADGGPVASVAIHQVGPTIHYLITLNGEGNKENAQHAGYVAVAKTNEVLNNPDVFQTYEAQIIVTKEDLKKPEPEVMLRPAADAGEEQVFPQYGVMNKKTIENGIGISWSRNG